MFLVAALHNSKDRSMECVRGRTVACFLVLCLGDWMCKPKTEQCQRSQQRQYATKQDSIPMQPTTMGLKSWKNITPNLGGLCAKCTSFVQDLAIWPESNKWTKNSHELSCSDLMEASRHCGYDLKCKCCVTNNGAMLTSADELHLNLLVYASLPTR